VLQVSDQLLPVQVNKFERQNAEMTLFPFQVPTVGDAARRAVLSVDWSAMVVHKFEHGRWQFGLSVKGGSK